MAFARFIAALPVLFALACLSGTRGFAAPSNCMLYLLAPEALSSQAIEAAEASAMAFDSIGGLHEAALAAREVSRLIASGDIEVSVQPNKEHPFSFKVRYVLAENHVQPQVTQLHVSHEAWTMLFGAGNKPLLSEALLEQWLMALSEIQPELRHRRAGAASLDGINLWDATVARRDWLEAYARHRGVASRHDLGSDEKLARHLWPLVQKLFKEGNTRDLALWFGLAEFDRISADFSLLSKCIERDLDASTRAITRRMRHEALRSGKFQLVFDELGQRASRLHLARELANDPLLAALSKLSESELARLEKLARSQFIEVERELAAQIEVHMRTMSSSRGTRPN